MSIKSYFPVSELTGFDPYKLATGLIVPRPIGWIGTLSAAGIANLAPFSFFNCVSGTPPIFVIGAGKFSRKDTVDNVKETGEFTINIVTDEVVEAMNQTAATVDADIDEFELAGLTKSPGNIVTAPMVAECKANIECKLMDIIELGEGKTGTSLVLGEGVAFHVAEDLLDGTRIDQAKLQAIGRHVGNTYSRSSDLFDLDRPH